MLTAPGFVAIKKRILNTYPNHMAATNTATPQGSGIKSLVKDTAIYGLSSIVGRFLNYLLVPLYTAKLAASSGGYGVITEVYSYVALLLVLLTFGMETTFFRFVNKEKPTLGAFTAPPSCLCSPSGWPLCAVC